MVLGADTGFFIAYVQNHPRATAVWQALMSGDDNLVVSTVDGQRTSGLLFQTGIK